MFYVNALSKKNGKKPSLFNLKLLLERLMLEATINIKAFLNLHIKQAESK